MYNSRFIAILIQAPSQAATSADQQHYQTKYLRATFLRSTQQYHSLTITNQMRALLPRYPLHVRYRRSGYTFIHLEVAATILVLSKIRHFTLNHTSGGHNTRLVPNFHNSTQRKLVSQEKRLLEQHTFQGSLPVKQHFVPRNNLYPASNHFRTTLFTYRHATKLKIHREANKLGRGNDTLEQYGNQHLHYVLIQTLLKEDTDLRATPVLKARIQANSFQTTTQVEQQDSLRQSDDHPKTSRGPVEARFSVVAPHVGTTLSFER